MNDKQLTALEKTLANLKKALFNCAKKYDLLDQHVGVTSSRKKGFVTYFTNHQSTFLLVMLLKFFLPTVPTRVLFIQKRKTSIPKGFIRLMLSFGAEVELVMLGENHTTLITPDKQKQKYKVDIQDMIMSGPLAYCAKHHDLIALNPMDGLRLLLSEKDAKQGKCLFRYVFPESIDLLLRGLLTHEFSHMPPSHLSHLSKFAQATFLSTFRSHKNFLNRALLPYHTNSKKMAMFLQLSPSHQDFFLKFPDADFRDITTMIHLLFSLKGQKGRVLQTFMRLKGWPDVTNSQLTYSQLLMAYLTKRFRLFEDEDWWIASSVVHHLRHTDLFIKAPTKAPQQRQQTQTFKRRVRLFRGNGKATAQGAKPKRVMQYKPVVYSKKTQAPRIIKPKLQYH